ncbi:N-acetylmuramoyl-L-alanine amidase [Eubacterium sp. An11]|uniref:peptidoglycan recognition protein family protein n=1 Tax=Eubacterium sp. An11 TaxID=1965542 RepID=UPI000B3A30F6|nr:peptidoglycan recognition family protein [Eubacterium sp. An11]OUQ69566.1 N-acetylmuramoyl-L-alanine amidase [Eubacterium sp. An11]
MALKFKKEMAHKSNYGGTRSVDDIKYIVIHYTGNNGDTAVNNCKYFQGANRNASAHYFVDGGNYVYKSVPVKSVAWSVGGFYSRSNGAGAYYQKCTNANSISIEMCNCVRSVPDKVFDQTVELTKYLMEKYDIPASRVIRHWDVNGKSCPGRWTGKNNSGWEKFKKTITEEGTKVAEKKDGCFAPLKSPDTCDGIEDFLHKRGFGAGEHNLSLIAAANCKKGKVKNALFELAKNGNLIKPDGLNRKDD